MKGMTHEETAEFRKKILAYRKDGHTRTETADHFNVTKQYVTNSCHGYSFPIDTETRRAAAKKSWSGNHYNQWGDEAEREQKAAKQVEERLPQFEYVGGFTGSNGFADIRCKKCGHVQRRSMVSIRHGYATCDVCRANQVIARKEEKARDAEEKREQRQKESAARKAAEMQAKEEKRAEREHPCAVCGNITTNQYCCSKECSNKRVNQIKEVRRRRKLSEAKVDKGITLQKLYRRDKGVCYICGGRCEWEDKTDKGTATVCGDNYPSIDHVIPLARGGTHEWGNVRLAHRRCNTIKRDKIIPLG